MSRSNPTENNPNPSTRWFEWDGEAGAIRYYDKTEKKNVQVGSDFTFILLDRLSTVKGWHEDSSSSIYSNEVKDTRAETLVVKAFKSKRILAEGFYAQIKDRVKAEGGCFALNCYIAFRNDEKELVLGSLTFKGGSLGEWMDFEKANRSDVWKKAVRIKGYTEGKKGKIVFRTPIFHIAEISEKTDAEAKSLDQQLQDFLKGYFKRTRTEQVDQTIAEREPEREQHQENEPAEVRRGNRPPADPDENDEPSESDIPF